MRHTVSALVKNHPGVLVRVSNLFSKRGFNIESVAVGITDSPMISRMTFIVNGDDAVVTQLIEQLDKLEDVYQVKKLKKGEYISRQLTFIKVYADGNTRGQITQIAEIFRAHIVDLSTTTVTIEISGNEEKTEALINMLTDFGILEIVRTGEIAIERGENMMKIN